MICPKCKKPAPWVENKEIYGRNYGRSYMCYYCKDCGTYVGCHNNTKKPLGTMADKETREWRKRVHADLDPLWKKGLMKRGEVYGELKRILGEEIHVGESDIDKCEKILKALDSMYDRSADVLSIKNIDKTR